MPDGWPLEPHLLAVVSALNANRDGEPLLTWQDLLTRAEATFDLGIRPLLDHARRLRFLRPLEGQAR
jgi:hypothetical protein